MGCAELIIENMNDMGMLRDDEIEKDWEARYKLRDYNYSFGVDGDFLTYTEYQLSEELLPDALIGEGLYGEKLLVASPDVDMERVAIYWYFKMNDGEIFDGDDEDSYICMDANASDLIIITSEWKKKMGIWQRAMVPFLLNCNVYDGVRVVVDDWDHVADYAFEKECYFIFDEYEDPLSGNNCEEAADSFFTIVDSGQMNSWIMCSKSKYRCGVFPALSSPGEWY